MAQKCLFKRVLSKNLAQYGGSERTRSNGSPEITDPIGYAPKEWVKRGDPKGVGRKDWPNMEVPKGLAQ